LRNIKREMIPLKEMGEVVRQNYILNLATAIQINKENQPTLFHPMIRRVFLPLNTCCFSLRSLDATKQQEVKKCLK